MRTIFSKSSNVVLHNTKVKEYLDGSYKVSCANSPVYKEAGWEAPLKAFVPKPKDMENETREDSLSRAKSKFVEICRCNDFTMFFTLTFNPEIVNSLDIDEVKKYVQVFFSNLVQRNNANYILVPETHKSGRIHIHGFMSANVNLTYSGTVRVKGHKKPMKQETAKRYGIPPSEWLPVYNLPKWKYGFSTVLLLDSDSDKTNMSKYMTKYICKDVQMIFGNYYLAGGRELVRNAPFYLCDLNYNDVDYQKEYECPYTGVSFRIFDSANFRPEVSADEFFDLV